MSSTDVSQEAESEYDYLFKIVLIGDSGVGKSQILSRFSKDEFSISSKATIGVEFAGRTIMYNSSKIKVQAWDTAGQERYKAISSTYYRGALGALVVYDVTQIDTFDSVTNWLNELYANAPKEVKVVLVGNKIDLEDSREVDREKAIKLSKEKGLSFIETSAKDATNIDKAFEILVGEIYKARSDLGVHKRKDVKVELNKEPAPGNSANAGSHKSWWEGLC